jgi:predicted O-methyltransferase YrrM
MDITNRLLSLDPTLQIHNEGEWTKTVGEYSAFNDAGVECEVGEFLYAMVRILKPAQVLETGTHQGIGASYMGMALKDNKKGQLTTCEFLQENHKIAKDRIARLQLNDFVKCDLIDVAFHNPVEKYQLILLDTEPQTRFAEFVKFYDWLDDGGFIFIHDLHRHMHQIPNAEHGFAWPFGPVPGLIRSLIASRKIVPFYFSTPRGLTGFYKASQDDYKFMTNPYASDAS